MNSPTTGYRFGWLSSVVGRVLPPEALAEAGAAWQAAADALGVDQNQLAREVARAFRVAVGDPTEVDPAVRSSLDPSIAQRFLAVPVHLEAHSLVVMTADPGNPDVVEHLSFLMGRAVTLQVAPPAALEPLLRGDPVAGLETPAEWAVLADGGGHDAPGLGELSEASRSILDRLVIRGIQLGASDLHVQATGATGTARFRVDGVLELGPQVTAAEMAAIIGRAKAVGGMDPSVRLRPQDGRARIRVGDGSYDLRISTIPASHSESLVIRILAQAAALSLDGYDADDDTRARLHQGFLDQTAGIFTVTGPTGSGKTTLLYAMLSKLNTPDRHIHTVEDPVEVEMQGLAQVQVNPKAGMTFGGALRSILRQDPDIILVGETRDAETANIVTQAALTGHLVATTLHTIDSATALLRFGELEVNPSELSEALNGISAQRLLRKLCPHCREPVADAADHNEEWFATVAGSLPAFRAVGCDRCRGSGYLGRFPAIEVLLVDDEVRRCLLRGARAEEVRAAARSSGLRTMGEIAFDRTRSGDTDVTEVRRVMGSDLLDVEGGVKSRGTAPVAVGATVAPDPVASPAAWEAPPQDRGYDALLVSHVPRLPVIVNDGLTRVGLHVHVESDIPAGIVWAEINRPRILVLDLSDPDDHPMRRLKAAYDALLGLPKAPWPIVIAPPDHKALERVLLEHNFVDYLRMPVSPDHIGFVAEQLLRRQEIQASAAAVSGE